MIRRKIHDGLSRPKHRQFTHRGSYVSLSPALALTFLLPALSWGQEVGDTADGSLPATPLSVSVDSKAKGDGATPISLSFSGGPEANPDELSTHPFLPRIECPKATVVAATRKAKPALVPTANAKAQTLSCTLQIRGASASFQVPVPAAPPGFHVEVSNSQPRAGDTSLVLRPFVVKKGASIVRPQKIRAAASAGSVALGSDKELTYTLPDSAAPRALAVVLSDGVHGAAVFFPFWGTTQLPVKTRARTRVQVRIAGTWFGPVEAKSRRAKLDISVPPGVRDAVVQAIGKRGNITETFADLKTPELPRIAALAAKESVEAGKTVSIFVALASPRGSAASADSEIAAVATSGKVSTPVSTGPGLWMVKYQAPTEVGTAELRFSVRGKADAGEALVSLRVQGAAASKIVFQIAKKAYQPGERAKGTLLLEDSFGNPVPASALKLTFAGQAVAITDSHVGPAFEIKIPDTLSADRKLALVASLGGASTSYTIETTAGPRAKAELRVTIDEREARLRVFASDRFGNAADTRGLTLEADAAKASALVHEGLEGRSVLSANAEARWAVVRLLEDGQELARKKIDFGRPRSAISFGAYANGAWTTNGGDLNVPRLGVGLGVRRALGPVDASLLIGLEAFSSEDKVVADVGGMQQSLIRELQGLAIPVFLQARMRVTSKIGVAAALGIVPVATSARLAVDKSERPYETWTTGLRGQLSADYRLGPGRITLGTSYGRAELKDGPIVGEIDGIRVYAGYEFWPFYFTP